MFQNSAMLGHVQNRFRNIDEGLLNFIACMYGNERIMRVEDANVIPLIQSQSMAVVKSVDLKPMFTHYGFIRNRATGIICSAGKRNRSTIMGIISVT